MPPASEDAALHLPAGRPHGVSLQAHMRPTPSVGQGQTRCLLLARHPGSRALPPNPGETNMPRPVPERGRVSPRTDHVISGHCYLGPSPRARDRQEPRRSHFRPCLPSLWAVVPAPDHLPSHVHGLHQTVTRGLNRRTSEAQPPARRRGVLLSARPRPVQRLSEALGTSAWVGVLCHGDRVVAVTHVPCGSPS